MAANDAPQGSQINQLPVFSGKSDQDVEVWIRQAEGVAAMFGWNDAQTASAAKIKMADEAAYWLQACVYSGTVYAAWAGANGLRTGLLGRFVVQINALAAVDAVSKLTQMSSESVGRFYDRCVITLNKKNFTYTEAQKRDAAYKTQFQVDLFVFFSAGLLPRIKSRATGGANAPQDITALKASALDAELFFSKQTAEVLLVEHESALPVVPAEPTPDDLSLKVAKLEAELAEVRLNRSPAAVKCYNCQGFGHISRNCASPRPPGAGRGRGRGGRGRGGRQGGAGGNPHKPKNSGIYMVDDEEAEN